MGELTLSQPLPLGEGFTAYPWIGDYARNEVISLTRRFSGFAAIIFLMLTLVGCGGDSSSNATPAVGNSNTPGGNMSAVTNPCTNGNLPASTADQLCHATPQGRVYVADQLADHVSVIDAATDQAYTSISTGQQPHHVAVNPANTELWVSLYGETYMQVFALEDQHEIAKVDLADHNDDLTFTPDGKLVFVSLGTAAQVMTTPTAGTGATTTTAGQVAVVDATTYKLIKKIAVGNTPHGIRVRPDGKEVYVTNTLSNDVTVIDVASLAVIATVPNVGANPFEVSFNPDGSMAYVSNFLGRSVAIIDTATHKRTGLWLTGQQPAMMWVSADDKTLYVASTGDGVLVVQDISNKGKVLHRIDSGHETHGVVLGAGKLFTTNIKDNTVTVIDPTSDQVLSTIAVGNAPNGLVYTPYKGPAGS